MDQHDQRIIHSSAESDWRTPPACFAALTRAFNFGWDLAADATSTLLTADSSGLTAHYLGPGSSHGQNSLDVAWNELAYPVGFLNPPYSKTRYRETQDPAYQIESWAQKAWEESRSGATVVGLFPFSPQTVWYRRFVYGHSGEEALPQALDRGTGHHWSGHAAMEEWRLPHRISFLRPDGSPASSAGVNSVVIVWRPNPGFVGPWQPAIRYWSYR